MYGFMICVVVAIAVIVPIATTARVVNQDKELQKLFELLQSQHKSHDFHSADQNDSEDSVTSGEDETSGDDNTRNSEARAALFDIIKQIVKDKKYQLVQKQRTGNKQRLQESNRGSKYEYSNDRHNSQNSNDLAQLIESLSGKDLKTDNVKLHSNMGLEKKRQTPNRLLGDVRDRNMNDYNSKIYLVLNPEALEKSKDRSSGINKLISKLLSLSSSYSNRDDRENSRQVQYKGFMVNDNIKRRRGSREMYGPNESSEDKQKRGRGGNGQGHTAIPYIRHRGENIYERD